MSENMPWFRFYNETIDDIKIQRISRLARQPPALIVGVWATLLALASSSQERGKLLISAGLPLTFDDIVFKTGLEDEPCKLILDAFVSINMLNVEEDVYIIVNWDKRQFASDSSNERVRRHRAKKSPQKEPDIQPAAGGPADNGAEPQEEKIDGYAKRYSNVTVTPPESDTESDTDTDITTFSDESPTSLKSTSPKSSVKKSQAKKTPETVPKKEMSPQQKMVVAIAEVCRFDLKIINKKQFGQLGNTAQRLNKAGVDPPQVVEFGQWWFAHDWRGKTNQPPQPANIQEKWGDFKSGKEQTNGTYGKNGQQNSSGPTEEQAKLDRQIADIEAELADRGIEVPAEFH